MTEEFAQNLKCLITVSLYSDDFVISALCMCKIFHNNNKNNNCPVKIFIMYNYIHSKINNNYYYYDYNNNNNNIIMIMGLHFLYRLMLLCVLGLPGLLVCRTAVCLEKSLDISIPLMGAKISQVSNVTVFLLLTCVHFYSLIKLICSYQRRECPHSISFVMKVVLELLFDCYIAWAVYNNWTVEISWLKLIQLLPTIAKNLNTFYQLICLALGVHLPMQNRDKFLFLFEAILNAVMIIHLFCHCIFACFRLIETMNFIYLGFLFGIFDCYYRVTAIRRFAMELTINGQQMHVHEQVELEEQDEDDCPALTFGSQMHRSAEKISVKMYLRAHESKRNSAKGTEENDDPFVSTDPVCALDDCSMRTSKLVVGN